MDATVTQHQAPGLPAFGELDVDAMAGSARQATDFLKAVGHEGRLMILCRLIEGECSVAELEALLGARQAAVSQQLARLRQEGLVDTRREGKNIYYFIADARVGRLVAMPYDMFCRAGAR